MPELRKDPIIGRWVIVSLERAKRPNDFKITHPESKEGEEECPFCEGKEEKTLPEIFAKRKDSSKPNSPGWQVRVVPSIAERLNLKMTLQRKGLGMYDVMNPVGEHEIIIESPDHLKDIHELSEEHIQLVMETSVKRIQELEKSTTLKYCLLFKNHGLRAGGSRTTQHLRSQIIATPSVPKRVKEELEGSRLYYQYKTRCIFCDIIQQELDSKKRVVLETDSIVALTPFASRFPFEVWILPKRHSSDFTHIQKNEAKDLATVFKELFSKLCVALNDPPYNYMLHTTPFIRSKRPGYWHTIKEDYHWHIEVTPRITHVAGFEWGSGFYINPTPPEEAAKYLREA